MGTGVLAHATIFPADRSIDWTQTGVPGGIPNRTVIGVTATNAPYNAIGDDSTDNKAALQAAISATPAGQVCMIPAGTYRVNGSLNVPSNITIRGAGIDQTIIKSVGTGAGLFVIGGSVVQYNPASITTTISAGATQGSTSITVAAATGISVGTYLVISETNDASFVSITSANGTAGWVDGWSDTGARARGQIVEVTSVSGTTVGFTPALYSNYSNTPWATRFTASCKNSGVENLTAYATNTGTNRNFIFQTAAYCWVNNVKGDFTDGDHCTLDWSYRCEVRHCYFLDAFIHHSGTYDTMIGLRYKTTGCLIVDNVCERLHVSIMPEWGAAGNVIAYNYTFGEFDDSASTGSHWLPMSIDANHGAHPQFNLYEGNVTHKFIIDSYWGTSGPTTVLRNWFLGHDTTYPPYSARGTAGATITLNQDTATIQLWEGQSKVSAVGNILGDSTLVSPTYKVINPAARGYQTIYIWNIGYASSADAGGTAILPNPNLTLIDHGNYDFNHKAIQWDPTIADHTIPNSLFLSAKPSWFGSLPWPAFDPNTPTPTTDAIPASYRRVHGMEAPGIGTPQAPTNATINVQTG